MVGFKIILNGKFFKGYETEEEMLNGVERLKTSICSYGVYPQEIKEIRWNHNTIKISY